MLIYISILLLFLLMFLVSRNRQIDKKFAFVSICILILLAGFKYRVGSDALLYQDIYEQYPTLNQLSINYILNSRWGSLFVIWFSLCHTLFHDFIYYQFIHAIILLSSVYLLIKHYTKMFMPAILMFSIVQYLFMTFDLYREGLAAAIYFFSIPFLEKKKYLIYYAFCFICFNIHVSSFLCFFVPLIAKVNLLKWTYKPFLIFFVLSFFVSLIIVPIVNLIPITSVRILALSYLGKGIEVEGMTFTRAIFVIVIYYFGIYKNIKFFNDKNILVLNLAYLSLLIETLQKGIPFVFRLNSYFSIFLVIGLAITIERYISVETNRTFYIDKYIKVLLIILLYSGPKILDYMKSEGTYNAYFPYVSVFNPHIISKREFHDINDYLRYDQ